MIAILYDLLYVIPLSLLAVAAGAPYFGGPENTIFLHAIAMVIVGISMTLKHWKNRMKFLIPGTILVLCAGVVLIKEPQERGEFLWQSQWILWVALTAVGCFFAGLLVAKVRMARRIMAVGLVTFLVLFMTLWTLPDKAAVALSLLLLVLVIVDEIQHYWEKSGYTDAKGHLVSVAPFLLALCIVVYLLPAPDHPYDWNFVVRLWERASSYVKLTSRWFHGADEDYEGVIGFSDEHHFWIGLKKKDQEMMTLSGGTNVGQVVYLSGKVLDTFDGRQWTAQNETVARDRMLDTLETVSAVTQYDPDYVRNYLWRVELKIRYEEFNTKYFFTPLKSILGKEKLGEAGFYQQGGDLLATNKLGYGTEYTLSFLRLNQQHVGFQTFLQEAQAPTKETWEMVREKYEPLDFFKEDGYVKNEGTAYEDYLAYVQRISQYYLPETHVSEQVQEYLDRLFDGAQSDLEKLGRIENLLASYQYSTHPGEIPADVQTPEDFLDYFLLESQTGYCSHFATAFVLLARSQGIPARYVQGFYVPKQDRESITVTSTMAHAWPEVYVKGVGWLPYEPTPGKKYSFAWAFKVKSDDSGPSAQMSHDEGEEEIDQELLLQEDEKTGVQIKWRVILIPAGLVLVFLLAFLLIDLAMIKAWYGKLSDAEKFQVTCKKSLKVLSLMGWELEQGETLEEFARRVGKKVPKNMLGFIEQYEWLLYAGKLPGKSERAEAEKELEGLLDRLKTIKGKWFFWYRYQIFRMEAGKKQLLMNGSEKA